VYGDAPPVTAPIVSVPLLAPQVELVGVTATAVGPLLLLIVAFVENVHPLASFTLTECDPAARLLYTRVELNVPPSTEYVYGDAPPVTAPIVNVPLLAPQVELVGVTATAVGPPLLLIVAFVEKVQPLASFTLNECEPAARLL
jgi:hypothetical protein